MKAFHLHLVSDSTGETVGLVARACLAQFENIETTEHLWNMIRSEDQAKGVITAIKENPGFVLYTIVNEDIRNILEEGCRRLQIPCIAILDPIIAELGAHLGAEMVLLGVSRTSKTPTSIYLANRGIKTANIPIVPGVALPEELFTAKAPLIVGLTKDPKRLVEIRRQRLRLLDQDEETDYVDLEKVSNEINEARRLFTKHNWTVINVSRKSIEETAATIIQLYNRRKEQNV
ncbi:MAG: kinase/pyrophosphorylase [Rhodospirillales bacterium]|nr:kinase/pyrophosphorylase [Rhodospirillales bacterium]